MWRYLGSLRRVPSKGKDLGTIFLKYTLSSTARASGFDCLSLCSGWGSVVAEHASQWSRCTEGQCQFYQFMMLQVTRFIPKHHNCLTEPISGPLADFMQWTECLCPLQSYMFRAYSQCDGIWREDL